VAARILKYESNGYDIEFSAPGPGMLVVSARYDEGWKALLNGQEAAVLKVGILFLGVYISGSGNHELHLSYGPASMVCALAVSLVSVAAVMILLVLAFLGPRTLKKIVAVKMIIGTRYRQSRRNVTNHGSRT